MKKSILLFVVNDAGFFLSHRLPVALEAMAEGYEVHVATPESSDVERITALGFCYHAIQLNRRGGNVVEEVISFSGLYRLFISLTPDIVHLVTIKPVLYGGIAARFSGVPAVVSAISGLGYIFVARGWRIAAIRRLVKWLYKFALGHANSITIFQNPEDMRTLSENGVVNKKGVALIRGSGADMDVYVPRPEPKGLVTVVLASRMLWDKGVGVFVEAAELLKRDGVRARFVLVGGLDQGNPNALPKSQLESWHQSNIIEWWGRCDDMPEVFSKAHIFCLPSKYGEGVPKVLIEAAACGRAIVTTNWPGCREVVRHNVNGLLVPVDNSIALANALKQLIENKELRQAMGRQGRKIAEEEFSVERVVKRTLLLYRELLD